MLLLLYFTLGDPHSHGIHWICLLRTRELGKFQVNDDVCLLLLFCGVGGTIRGIPVRKLNESARDYTVGLSYSGLAEAKALTYRASVVRWLPVGNLVGGAVVGIHVY